MALCLALLSQIPPSAQTITDVLLLQSQADADRKSAGCRDLPHPHRQRPPCTPPARSAWDAPIVTAEMPRSRLTADASAGFCRNTIRRKRQAHPQPRESENAAQLRQSRREPTPTGCKEDWDYIRFVNPGDLRVAEKTCGTSGCHTAEVRKVQTSMMTHGAMLWGAALYNNGAVPLKTPHFGESYGPDGTAATPDSPFRRPRRRDQQERSAAVSRSVAALGNFAARQRAARLRARQAKASLKSGIPASKKTRASRRSN